LLKDKIMKKKNVNIITIFVWLLFALALIIFYDKEPESTIMTWSCIIIANIYINSIKNK